MPSFTQEITSDTSNGITDGNFDAYGSDRTIPRAMTAFSAIAWYNTVEILVLSAFVFKRYTGLYFWSVIVCALSIAVYATGAWTYQNVNCVPKPIADGLMTAGWVVMIPSQSIVLWSRLHLVTLNWKLLRFLLWMIAIGSVCCIIPTCVLNWGSLVGHYPQFIKGYNIIEKIQMCIFTAQEVVISGVYLAEVRKVMKVICETRAKTMMKQLICMNILVIFLDLGMLSIEFCNLFMIQVTMKSMVYSVKLKVEFAVLSKIVSVVQEKSDSDQAVEVGAKQAWDPMLVMDVEKAASPRVSAARTSRTNSSDPLNSMRFQSLDSTRFQSFDGSVAHNLKYPEAAAQASAEDDSRYVRSLQQNVPADWRLSIGHEALSGPNLFEIRQLSLTGNENDSIESVRGMYPGRLDKDD